MFDILTKKLLKKNKTLAEKVKKVEAREKPVSVLVSAEGVSVNMYVESSFRQKVEEIDYWDYFVSDEDRKMYRDFAGPLSKELSDKTKVRLQKIRDTYDQLVKAVITETATEYQDKVMQFIKEHGKRK